MLAAATARSRSRVTRNALKTAMSPGRMRRSRRQAARRRRGRAIAPAQPVARVEAAVEVVAAAVRMGRRDVLARPARWRMLERNSQTCFWWGAIREGFLSGWRSTVTAVRKGVEEVEAGVRRKIMMRRTRRRKMAERWEGRWMEMRVVVGASVGVGRVVAPPTAAATVCLRVNCGEEQEGADGGRRGQKQRQTPRGGEGGRRRRKRGRKAVLLRHLQLQLRKILQHS